MSAANRTSRIAGIAVGVLLTVFLALFPAGCGKKGPPRLPDAPELPEVSDLSHRLEGDGVVLKWSVPGESLRDITGFYIYRSSASLSEAPCEGCPLVFEKAAIVAVDAQEQKTGRFVYQEPLLTGYRYAYKVMAYRESSGADRASNVVRFETRENP